MKAIEEDTRAVFDVAAFPSIDPPPAAATTTTTGEGAPEPPDVDTSYHGPSNRFTTTAELRRYYERAGTLQLHAPSLAAPPNEFYVAPSTAISYTAAAVLAMRARELEERGLLPLFRRDGRYRNDLHRFQTSMSLTEIGAAFGATEAEIRATSDSAARFVALRPAIGTAWGGAWSWLG